MNEVISIAFGYPTVIFTVLAILCLVYWGTVFLGLLDIDLFGGDAELGDGADAGDLADGGDAGDGVDAGDGDVADVATTASTLSFLSAFNLRRAPLTITLSVLTLFGWALSAYGALLTGASGFLFGTLLLAATLLLAVPLTSLVTWPIGKLFLNPKGTSRKEFIGQVVRIRIDAGAGEVGQGQLTDGPAILLRVRSDEAGLASGSEALIVDYDEDNETYAVEPMDDLLKNRVR